MKEVKPWSLTRSPGKPDVAVQRDESNAVEINPIVPFGAIGSHTPFIDFSPIGLTAREAADPAVTDERGDEDPKENVRPADSSAMDNAKSSSEDSIPSSSETGGTGTVIHPSDLPPSQETPASAEKEQKSRNPVDDLPF